MLILRVLLRLLPAPFRREYGAELLETAAARWRALRPALGFFQRLRFWWRQWVAVVRLSVARRAQIAGPRPTGEIRLRRTDLGGWVTDLRHGARSLLARPGVALVAALTVALGVGVTTAMFSAVNAVLIRGLPYHDANDIVVLRQTDTRFGTVDDGVSAANLGDVVEVARTVSHAAGAEMHGLRLFDDGRAVSLRAWLVTDGFFDVMGTRVQLGRAFYPEEFLPGNERVVLLSHAVWQTRFGGDPALVGRDLILDEEPFTVVGVLPPGFRYPSDVDLWAPRTAFDRDPGTRGGSSMDAVARLAPGITLDQAQAEFNTIAADLREGYPRPNRDLGLRLIPLRQHLFGDVQSPLILLMGAVGLVLLIAAANVAGLQLARGAARAREYAVRGALGAGGARLLRLVAVESLLLAGIGGVMGIGLAFLGMDVIRFLAPADLPRIDQLSIDRSVLAFALLATLGTAVLAGITPAIRASRMAPHVALSEGTRGTTGGRRASRLRDRLVVAEIALAFVLTIGAGLLVRSFDRLLDNELGFDPEGRLAVQIWAYGENHAEQLGYFERTGPAIAAVPGVDAVGLTTDLPLADDRAVLSRTYTLSFTVAGRPAPAAGDDPVAGYATIDGGYAEAMGIALRAGRTFSTVDHAESPPVVMINEAFARRHFPDRSAIGQWITPRWRSGTSREIVGVLADVRRQGFESEPRPEIYFPLSQERANGLTFVVATAGDPLTFVASVQDAMWAVDPNQATWAMQPMSDLLSDWLRQRRFNTGLLVAFAGLALALAAIGVYGLMAFSVEQRVGELGIRRALGGPSGAILGMVLRRGLTLAAAGAGLGLLGAVALGRVVRGMLFGIHGFDPMTFGLVLVVVVSVGVVAALVPGWRAVRVSPMTALRGD